MRPNLLSAAALAVLLAAGAAGAWLLLRPAPAGDGATAAAPQAALCAVHGIPRDVCPFCDPGLIEALGECTGHGVPEALCTRCNAVLIAAFKVEGDWCAEHGLPESQCLICNPAPVLAAAIAPGVEPDAASPDTDRTPRWKRRPSPGCTKGQSLVRLAPEAARAAGLELRQVVARPVRQSIWCNAELAFDGDRYARLAPRAAGVISAVQADLGDRVQPGDVLAVVESVELGSAKAAYLQALTLVRLWETNHQREQGLADKHVSTERDVLEAETRLVESRIALANSAQRLRNLGLSEADIARVERDQDAALHLPVTAPFAGTVVERDAVIGETAGTARALFAVADTASMWAWLDLYEADVSRVVPGQPVEIAVEGLEGRPFSGTVDRISAHVDPRTRTLKVRATIANAGGLLRANMFGRGEIVVRELAEAILVPKAAVQWEGCCNVVFVRRSDTVYEPCQVALADERDGHYVVAAGLAAGQTIVTEGAFLFKTELLKGSIGAGCCEVDPGATRKDGAP